MIVSNFDVVRFPLVTEKSTILAEQNKYVFAVNPSATKDNILKAISDIFAVEVKKVNIVNLKGKEKRFKGRLGRRSGMKKAIVTLGKDQTIDLSGGIK